MNNAIHKLFRVDQQTYHDLEVFGIQKPSVFSCYDFTVTDGGREALLHIFQTPLRDYSLIRERQAEIRFCIHHDLLFPFELQLIREVPKYWTSSDPADYTTPGWIKSLYFWTRHTSSFYYKRQYIQDTVFILQELDNLLCRATESEHQTIPPVFRDMQSRINTALKKLLGDKASHSDGIVTTRNIDRFDQCIREELRGEFTDILQDIWQLDAWCSIVQATKKYPLAFPTFSKDEDQTGIRANGLYHIFQHNPVTNDLHFDARQPVWFLTGANMAGKSTFIKAFALAVYLAHTGLPVSATDMSLPILDGLYTTVNIEDDLQAGYSQFYQEAVRLREIASDLESPSRALIIFDELFKGTNYQDAYQATKEVLHLVAKIVQPYVIISSHLTELGKDLIHHEQVRTCKIATDIDDNGQVLFHYKLRDGIAEERLGMWLLQDSGAMDALKWQIERPLENKK